MKELYPTFLILEKWLEYEFSNKEYGRNQKGISWARYKTLNSLNFEYKYKFINIAIKHYETYKETT